MTAQLTRLRIAGFKSFAEPVSLDILPGLTGIVGPNGCGKSNVVEALRWAMGETSARALRGGEMDDVIFAGTTARASRNLAEVTVTLAAGGQDNAAGLPAPFQAEAELQVTRRIERGAGSQFRANGRELRARDVQTLYADLASGARSSGMVSQGRVSALVNARPEERRQVLEEAAGITGLHARRHEAELKLRAAEQNVSRAEDLHTQLEATREGLRKQARQAARYRNISGLIRNAEADHLAILHAQAQAALGRAVMAFEAARIAASEAVAEAQTAAGALADAEAAVPAPRAAEAEARSVLERRRLEAETLAAEAERIAAQAAESEARLVELEADLASARRADADADASVRRLSEDAQSLTQRLEALPREMECAAANLAERAQAGMLAQQAADAASLAASAAAAEARQAEAIRTAAMRRADTLRAQTEAARAAHALAVLAMIPPAQLAESAAALAAAEAALGNARDLLATAEADRKHALAAHHTARLRAEQQAARLQAAGQAEAEASAKAQRLAQAVERTEQVVLGLQAGLIDTQRLARAREAAALAAADLESCEMRLDGAEQNASAAASERAESARLVQERRAARLAAQQAEAASAARADRLHAEAEAVQSAWAEAEAAGPTQAEMEAAEAARRGAESDLAAQEASLRRLQDGVLRAAEALADTRAQAEAAEADAVMRAAEVQGLAALLGGAAEQAGVLASLDVPPGLEAACAAALGEGCDAGLDNETAKFWRCLPGFAVRPILPHGSVALADLMPVPPALSRALSHIAVLEEGADGDALQAGLAQGVIAVARSGAAWRWDGHVTRAGAPNAAATRLHQRRQLEAARAALARAEAAAGIARAQATASAADAAAATGWQAAARDAVAKAEDLLRESRGAADTLATRFAQAEARRDSLRPGLGRLEAERAAALLALADARQALAELPDEAKSAAALDAAARSAREAASALDDARLRRQAARLRLTETQQAAQRLHAEAAEADRRHEAAGDALARSRADLAEALAGLATATANRRSLPAPGLADLARIEAEAAAASSREAEALDRRGLAEQALAAAQEAHIALRASHAEASSHASGLAGTLARLEPESTEAAQLAADADHAMAALPDVGALAAAGATAQAALETARGQVAAAETSLAALHAERRQSEAFHTQVSTDLQAWQARRDEASARVTALAARRDAARQAAQALAAAPAGIAARAARSGEVLAQADATHRAAFDRLQAAEQRARALAMAQRDAEQAVGAGRERLVRAEATRDGAAGALRAVLARAEDRLGAEAVLPPCDDESDGAEERARKKHERLGREREEMGPVNLRAELEMEELDQRIATLDRERAELGTAIAKLRGAIGHLNREGRERLTAVFTQVDQHFRTLFTRMMGGGRAHLALTGSEDPLQAGLEIYAEPPGKKLASLALLSGGEQALTALSLIFAVFRCTPAPISVLDEVDAPLDDANVERFCSLLDDVVRDTGTRFLVVTHHQLTMSRMDRLFGVTMQERGVSRLLSVDLRQAAAIVEPRLQAAE